MATVLKKLQVVQAAEMVAVAIMVVAMTVKEEEIIYHFRLFLLMEALKYCLVQWKLILLKVSGGTFGVKILLTCIP